MTRMEAEFVQREAPPSYGQLIAQGLIPPVEDFPVYNPTQVVHSLTVIHSGPEIKHVSKHVTNCCNFGNWLQQCSPSLFDLTLKFLSLHNQQAYLCTYSTSKVFL